MTVKPTPKMLKIIAVFLPMTALILQTLAAADQITSPAITKILGLLSAVTGVVVSQLPRLKEELPEALAEPIPVPAAPTQNPETPPKT